MEIIYWLLQTKIVYTFNTFFQVLSSNINNPVFTHKVRYFPSILQGLSNREKTQKYYFPSNKMPASQMQRNQS